MATFAITGIRRSRLKKNVYRPSYEIELMPIYEDAPTGSQRVKFHPSIPQNEDYVYVPSCIHNNSCFQNGSTNSAFVHNYEEIDDVKFTAADARRSRFPSKTSNHMTSMLDGIMNSRLSTKHRYMHTDVQSECDRYKHKGEILRIDSASDEPTKFDDNLALSRCSSLYQGHPMDPAKTMVINSRVESVTEMYRNENPTKKWPKLEPQSPKYPHFWCPAEKKIKSRCFAVCFIVLLLVIASFMVVSLDGWLFKARGRGISGRDNPILRGSPTMFASDPSNFTDNDAENFTDSTSLLDNHISSENVTDIPQQTTEYWL